MKRKTLRIVLSIVLLVIVFLTTACAGTGPKKLSNEYVTVENYQGVEIEKVEADEATEEDVDKVVNHMMSSYIRQKDRERIYVRYSGHSGSLSCGVEKTDQRYEKGIGAQRRRNPCVGEGHG